MKWAIHNPVAGERRTKKRFAWQPVTVIDKDGNPVKVWLEFYWSTEEFVQYQEQISQEWKVIGRGTIIKKKTDINRPLFL